MKLIFNIVYFIILGLSFNIRNFNVDRILSFIMAYFISLIAVNTIFRIVKFFSNLKKLKVISYIYIKNIFLLVSSILYIIILPILGNFIKNDDIVIINMKSLLFIIIVAILFGLNSFMGPIAEVYKSKDSVSYTVRNGIMGSELFTINAGNFDEGFIIDTYLFKYKDIINIEKDTDYLRIYGIDSMNSDIEKSYKLLIETEKTKQFVENLIIK